MKRHAIAWRFLFLSFSLIPRIFLHFCLNLLWIMIKKGDKKIINAWAFYDWANSVYNLVITAAIFPTFYAAQCPDEVSFFGSYFDKFEIYSYVSAASFLTIALFSPILSGIADASGNKKKFMQFFCYLGAASCISLFWFDPNHLELGMLSIYLASIGFWSSFIFYNAYLPEIAEPEEHDRISAKGFILGYIGSSILLILCLAIIMGIDKSYTNYSFLLVGVWWAGFSQYTFKHLPNNVFNKKIDKGTSIFKRGFQEIRSVAKQIIKIRSIWVYLLAFFFFNMGVQTIMQIASAFGSDEVKVPVEALIISILIIQFLGALGAYVMSRVSKRIGNINTLLITVFLWIVICIVAYYTYTQTMFYVLAAGVGFIMGGIQSQARSTYAKRLPDTHDHASFFSFYDVLEKIGLSIGMFGFGFLIGVFGNMRVPILMLIAIFVLAFVGAAIDS